ncbi:hypothetical protein GGF46_002460 [Coemansia sp. RSA 552]|nr:hypothetical protein GGF46_002460 [Coemansia sp. RSA 552]
MRGPVTHWRLLVLYALGLAVLLAPMLGAAANSGPERPLTTFVDLLSSSQRFSEFLHTAQRLRMVIPLNRLRNATMFVPTNAAIRRHRQEHGESATRITGSTYRGISSSQAWYHVVGDGAIELETLTQRPMVWESLCNLEDVTGGLSPPSRGAVTPATEGLSGVMLKTQLSSDSSVTVNGVPVLAKKYTCAAGNVYMVDGLLDIPPPIEELLQNEPPTDDDYSAMAKLLETAGWSDTSGMHTLWAFSNRAFGQQFSYGERSYLLYGAQFADDDDELRSQAVADTRRVASRFVTTGAVSLARLGPGKHTVPSIKAGTNLTVIVEEAADGSLTGRVDEQPVRVADVIGRNGVVHGIDQVRRPDDLELSPQKVLVGLNATVFVRLMKDTGLGDYIDGTRPDRKLTLLVPTNHAMEDAFGYELGDDVAPLTIATTLDPEDLDLLVLDTKAARAGWSPDSPRARQRNWALYHIVDGQYGVSELTQSPLLRTELAAEATHGKRQVVKAQTDPSHGALANHVSFNGADNILLEPAVVGNTTIYLLSSPMPTPPRLINALIQNLDLSLFVAAMGASGTVDEVQQEAGVTVLAPVVGAFTSLGLVWSYLSLPGDTDARRDLGRLIKSHVLERPVYSDEIPLHTDSSAKVLVVKALNGNTVGLYRTPHGVFAAIDQDEQAPPARSPGTNHASPLLSSISDDSALKMSELDVLLHTGVAHVIDHGLILPRNVEITPPKLLRGMRARIFADLLERFNLTHVLDDPRSSEAGGNGEGEDDDPGPSIVGYSLLVPSDKSWRENAAYRELYRRDHGAMVAFDAVISDDDIENPWRNSTTADIAHYLDRLVRLHVIPIYETGAQGLGYSADGGGRLPASKLLLADRKSYPTLLEDVTLRADEFARDRFSIRLEGAPFYQSPGGVPFVSVATIVRAGVARTGAVFELDTTLRLPPEDTTGPGGWKRAAWNAAVWLTGIGMGSGLLGVSGFWVRQWWIRADYQTL